MSDPQVFFLGALIFMVGTGIIRSLGRVIRELERIYIVLDNRLSMIDLNVSTIRNDTVQISTAVCEFVSEWQKCNTCHLCDDIDTSDDMR